MDSLTLLSRVDAILSVPDIWENTYRELRLMRWDDRVGDSVEVVSLFQPHTEPLPDTLRFEGHTYRAGQSSGPRCWLVWFDREGD